MLPDHMAPAQVSMYLHALQAAAATFDGEPSPTELKNRAREFLAMAVEMAAEDRPVIE